MIEKIIFMRQLSSITLLLVLLAGCASFTARSVRIDSVAGDLVIREIATDCQMTAGSGTSIDGSATVETVPVTIGYDGDGVDGYKSLAGGQRDRFSDYRAGTYRCAKHRYPRITRETLCPRTNCNWRS